MKKSIDLGQGNVTKLLFKLAIPAITAQIINVLYNIVDRMYIGHIADIGFTALTGVGVCFPLISIVTAFASLMSAGSAAKASIMLGRQDKPSAEKILGNSFSLLGACGVVLTAVLLIWGRQLLLLFGADAETIIYAWDYMQIYSIGSIFVMFALGLNVFISCQGNTKVSMLSTIIGAVTNIVLDPIFIFGLNMGVKGAAWATIISQGISAIWIVGFLISKNTVIKLKIQNLKLDFKIILPCIALGFSPFIMQSTEGIINICFNTSLLKYGGNVAVGTMTVLSSLMQFMMLPTLGFTQGAQPIISYNYGAGNTERVRKTFRSVLICCLAYSVFFAAAVMTFPTVFASLFNNDAALLASIPSAMRVYFIGTTVFGIQIACQQTFIALGNAKTSVFLAILRKIILLVPLIYILPLFLENKVMAVYLAEPIADIISVITAGTMFMIYFRKVLKQMREAEKAKLLNN
ncbi:MAG: MATE family efflux transporter [Clostridia bacterium]